MGRGPQRGCIPGQAPSPGRVSSQRACRGGAKDIPHSTMAPGSGVRAGTNPGNWPFINAPGPPIEGAWLSTDPGYSGLACPTIGRGHSHTQARPIGLARHTIGRGYSHTQARPVGLVYHRPRVLIYAGKAHRPGWPNKQGTPMVRLISLPDHKHTGYSRKVLTDTAPTTAHWVTPRQRLENTGHVSIHTLTPGKPQTPARHISLDCAYADPKVPIEPHLYFILC